MDEINELDMLPVTCAACKYLRRRCDDSCIVAQYFPPERNEDFKIVHRLFGIQNVLKILNSVDEDKRDKAIETLIIEAKIWRENPARGCLGIERKLQAELEMVTKELHEVSQQLHFLRGNGQAEHPPMEIMRNVPFDNKR